MNIRFSGFGGQGIVMAGLIVGEAAILEGNNALQTQSYGSAARGGACKSDVIVSNGEIHELEFEHPDILVSMSQEAYYKYGKNFKSGVLVVDQDLVTPTDEPAKTYKIQATEIAYRKFNRKIVANLVILGFLSAVAAPVSRDAMCASIEQRVPRGTEKMNLEAFREGYRLGIEQKKDK